MEAKIRGIWAGLVSYANGTATDTEVRSTVADCAGWISLVATFGLLKWIGNDGLATEVAKYRPAIDTLLRFLCSGPKSDDRKLPAESFLLEHGQHIGGITLHETPYKTEVKKLLQNFNYAATESELESIEKQCDGIWNNARYRLPEGTSVGKDLLPLRMYVPAKDYQDLADPICDFLMSQYSAYLSSLSRPYSRHKKPAPIVPIFVCPRCNKLVMPERTGKKQYCSDCSDRARTEKYRQKAPADERKDYQWLYRLHHKEPSLRKVFLRSQKNQERLKQVKARQRESSRCQRFIREMHL